MKVGGKLIWNGNLGRVRFGIRHVKVRIVVVKVQLPFALIDPLSLLVMPFFHTNNKWNNKFLLNLSMFQ